MNKLLRICLLAQGDHGWQGGVEYTRNLILALSHLPQEFRKIFDLSLLSKKTLDIDLEKQISPYLDRRYSFNSKVKSLNISDEIYFRVKSNLFFLKNHINFVYPYFSRTRIPRLFRSASWITDFQHRHLPQFFPPTDITARERVIFTMTKGSANNIVLSSETARSDLRNFYPGLVANTFVLNFKTFPNPDWYEGDPIQVQKKFNLPDRFFIVCNQFWQHKNHMIVFKALKILKERSLILNVVCTGHIYDWRKPHYSDDILQAVHQLGLASQVFLLGLVSRNEQILLMRRALAVVQPSLFEGWSTVVEDAGCIGKPLILSDLPIHREQNPAGSLFYDSNSADQLASSMAHYWEHLSPGPNREDESRARLDAIKASHFYGKTFLEIAYNCVYSRDLNLDVNLDVKNNFRE